MLRIWNILESFTILFLMLLSYLPDSSVMSSGKQNIPLEWRTCNKVLVFFSFSKQKYAHEKQCLLLNGSITYESLSPPTLTFSVRCIFYISTCSYRRKSDFVIERLYLIKYWIFYVYLQPCCAGSPFLTWRASNAFYSWMIMWDYVGWYREAC